MIFLLIWGLSVVATAVVAEQKNIGAGGFFILSLFTGPIALIIACATPAKPKDPLAGTYSIPSPEVNSPAELRVEIDDLKKTLERCRGRMANLEGLADRYFAANPTSTGAKQTTGSLTTETSAQQTPPVSAFPDGSNSPENNLPSETEPLPPETSWQGKSYGTTAAPAPELPAAATPAPSYSSYPTRLSETESPRGLQSPREAPAHSDFETSLGKNWLNKIGVLVLALGVTFLVGYSFKYFGPWLKIMTGFALGGLLFFAGHKFEASEKLKNFGRVLLGGAWAIVYLTTYAMYHFEASRVIASQTFDLILLGIVAVGIILHALKYKSEELVCVALGVAYLTSTIDQISWFSVGSCFLLAFTGLFLVQRFQWVKTLITGMLFTYGVSVILGPHFTPEASDMQKFTLLTGYWAIFLVGIHLLKASKDEALGKILSAANFGNIAIYSLLSAPLVLSLFNGHQAGIALGEGLAYLFLAAAAHQYGKPKLYVSDLIAGLFAVTFAIFLKFLPSTTLVLWLIEIPFLLFIGIQFKERLYRFFAYLLSLASALHLFAFCVFNQMPDVVIGELSLPWQGFISLVTAISMGICFALARRAGRENLLKDFETNVDHVFSAAAGVAFTVYLWSAVPAQWLSLAWFAEGFVLIAADRFSGLGRFRAYAYLVFIAAIIGFLISSYGFSRELRPFLVVSNTLLPLAAYYIVKHQKNSNSLTPLFEGETPALFVVAGFVLLVSAFRYIAPEFLSLSLGILGVLFVIAGFMGQEKIERTGGLVLFGITLLRIIFYDIAGLPMLFKIITFIVLGALFIGVSYLYNRFTLKK